MANYLSTEKADDIRERIRKGESARDIARSVGVIKNTVLRYLREMRMDTAQWDDAPLIVLPEKFKHPRYMGGLWLDMRRHWPEEDIRLLSAACDLQITPNSAANTLGRNPEALAWKAISLGMRIPRSWIQYVYSKPRRSAPLLNLNYPFIVKPDARHEDLLAVNRMVSQAMPGREDVVQDVMLALWESRTSLEELRKDPKALRAFASSFRKASFERSGYGVESMDVTIHSNDGDGKSKYEDATYGYTPDFSDSVIAALSNEEETLGVSAAFWSRLEMA